LAITGLLPKTEEPNMMVSTTDPITLNDVTDPESHPYVIEGEGPNAIKIYFESEATKQEYLDISVEHPGSDFTTNLDNPAPMGGDRPSS
jgi:hypothetical protein